MVRGHQVRRHPCKLGNLAIFYNAKKSQKITFSIVFANEKGVDRINPPPSIIRVKNTPSKVRYEKERHPIKQVLICSKCKTQQKQNVLCLVESFYHVETN